MNEYYGNGFNANNFQGRNNNAGYYSTPGTTRSPSLANVRASQQGMTNSQTSVMPIIGRIVEDPSEVMPKEIPMDQTVAFFPVRNLSAIYAKQWNNDGCIDTIKYVPYVEPSKADSNDEILTALSDIQSRLNKIEDRLNRPFNKQKNSQNQQQNTQKEDSQT